jgi:hypothetical protein
MSDSVPVHKLTTTNPILFGIYISLILLHILQTLLFIIYEGQTHKSFNIRKWKIFSQLLLIMLIAGLILITNGAVMHLAEADVAARTATTLINVISSCIMYAFYVYYIYVRTRAILPATGSGSKRLWFAKRITYICISIACLSPVFSIIQTIVQLPILGMLLPIFTFIGGFVIVFADVFFLVTFTQFLRKIHQIFGKDGLPMEQLVIARYGTVSCVGVIFASIWYTVHVLTGPRQGYGFGLFMLLMFTSLLLTAHVLIQMKWRLENRNWHGIKQPMSESKGVLKAIATTTL